MYKIPIPLKSIPMILDDSFTPDEFLSKIAFKVNELIDKTNNMSERLTTLENNFNTKFEELKNEILASVDDKIATAKQQAIDASKAYTDEKIREALASDIITAENFDNLEMTAQQFDSLELTAWQYDTASNNILVPPNL